MWKKNAGTPNPLGTSDGFTLIETIAVLILVVVVGALVLARLIGTDEAGIAAEVDTLKMHLRYAQSLAMNDVAPARWGIQVRNAGYSLVCSETGDGASLSSPFNLPGESSPTRFFASGVTASPALVLFDEWGSPGSAPAAVSIGGKTITVTANTGFIP